MASICAALIVSWEALLGVIAAEGPPSSLSLWSEIVVSIATRQPKAFSFYQLLSRGLTTIGVHRGCWVCPQFMGEKTVHNYPNITRQLLHWTYEGPLKIDCCIVNSISLLINAIDARIMSLSFDVNEVHKPNHTYKAGAKQSPILIAFDCRSTVNKQAQTHLTFRNSTFESSEQPGGGGVEFVSLRP